MLIIDRVQFSTERKYTDEGYLVTPCVVGRTGIQLYLGSEIGKTGEEADQIFRVYRPAEEVFKPETLNSFKNKPVTNDHPPELVTPENFKSYVAGSIIEDLTRDGDLARTFIQINDAEAIAGVVSGKCELSLGYTCDIELTSGVSENGEVYDAIQRNILGNHVAIVNKGRAGTLCRIADNSPTSQDTKMPKLTLDGVDFEATEQVVQAVSKLTRKLKDAEAKVEEVESEKKKAEDNLEEVEAEKKKVEDDLEEEKSKTKESEMTDAKLDELVLARAKFLDSAKLILGDSDITGKSKSEIVHMVCADRYPNLDLKGKSESYIAGLFDSAVSSIQSNPSSIIDSALARSITNTPVKDSSNPVMTSREKFIKDSQDAWKFGSKQENK